MQSKISTALMAIIAAFVAWTFFFAFYSSFFKLLQLSLARSSPVIISQPNQVGCCCHFCDLEKTLTAQQHSSSFPVTPLFQLTISLSPRALIDTCYRLKKCSSRAKPTGRQTKWLLIPVFSELSSCRALARGIMGLAHAQAASIFFGLKIVVVVA